ncbi:AcrR family transcriptional regulator [Streptosporangium becharense]|uniref:AcrR family transcriptional regulator n=1 Tax=Streptosporangium becharense TaxID=1816182 RepID=A0A7W9MEW7_9ACTN|nr:TetR/AcrR family transcriptional regulator [Streptosporangium becharense]MBB2913597.1 AcrR family transcriptional regulator [Streptosporangium becharense]MBB5817678.1 AcrR family transcriptional regulator [Streptosporangium becharense]
MRDHADTRTRIQDVALRRFAEQGYEATSLREIAEELGVTKAALYYHFKTKEDIVTSLVEDRVRAVEELITWAETRPRTEETRRELIRRYSEGLRRGRHSEIMRLLERNQPALKHHPAMEKTRARMFDLIAFLVEPGDPAATRLRNTMALFALHAAWFGLPDETISDDERQAAALEVAFDLLRR